MELTAVRARKLGVGVLQAARNFIARPDGKEIIFTQRTAYQRDQTDELRVLEHVFDTSALQRIVSRKSEAQDELCSYDGAVTRYG